MALSLVEMGWGRVVFIGKVGVFRINKIKENLNKVQIKVKTLHLCPLVPYKHKVALCKS